MEVVNSLETFADSNWSWCHTPELCQLRWVYPCRIKISYYSQLTAQCQCVILQLKHYVSTILQSVIDHHQGDHTSINKYEV